MQKSSHNKSEMWFWHCNSNRTPHCCGTLKCWKLKKIISFILFLFSFSIFLSFLILQARNQHIWLEKRTLWLNLPFGRQPLKPLGVEVTHPPWPPSVHITNHHYHLHNQYILHTTYRTTTPYPQSHGHAWSMRLMQAKLVDFPRSDLV